MAVGGDPDTLRDKARVLRTWALDVQTTRESVAGGSGVQWVSTAADRYRERLAEHSRSIDDARNETFFSGDEDSSTVGRYEIQATS